jgi:hypothetical protein
MNRRLAVLGVTAVILVMFGSIPVATQAPAGGPTTMARTPWGDPDLQGTWNFATITPLERPAELGERQAFTEEEARARDTDARTRNDSAPSAGSPGTYNSFWWDRGQTLADRRASLIVEPADGRIPPLTPEGERRAAIVAANRARDAFGPEDRSVGERCILGFNAGPPIVPAAYNQHVQVFQTPGYVVLLNEMVHNARIIPLDGRPHATIRQWNGDSRGRWEGNTLVVETINFYKETSLRGSTPNMRLVERLTRVDANRVNYEFTVTDPTTWTQPWTAALPMTRTTDLVYEYACHEGNYGMTNLLAGARRIEEAAAKQGRAR